MYQRDALLYENPLATMEDLKGFKLEGDGVISFPMGRMRLENKRNPDEGQDANYVLWCDVPLPDHVEISWDFIPIREPGLCVFFFSAKGKNGEHVLDPTLNQRTGPYGQYHSGDINAYHISYFRRRYPSERSFHLCNLRKSCGFHLVEQSADPIPSVMDVTESYRIKVVKSGPHVVFYINDMQLFEWEDDGETYGPILEGGSFGFRQMAPLMAEYSQLEIYQIKWLEE